MKEPEKYPISILVTKTEGKNTYTTWEELADTSNWPTLFNQVGAANITRSENGDITIPIFLPTTGPKNYITYYIRASDDAHELKNCDSTFQQLDCGFCEIELTNHWRASYAWFPGELLALKETRRAVMQQCMDTGSMPKG